MVYAWPRYGSSSELPDIGRRTWYRARDHPDELNIDYLVIYFNTNKAAILPRSEGGVLHRKIVGFHQDERLDWVADLECGHGQHVRHNPPWVVRPWVVTPEGRETWLGAELDCKRCDEESEKGGGTAG